MAATTVNARSSLTNGVSFGKQYTVLSADLTAKDLIFDFGVNYNIVGIVNVRASTGINKVLTGLRITYPAVGKIELSEGYVAAINEVSTVTALANTSGSLNGKYFTLNSPTVGYYIWFSTNGTGVDPAVGGRTGINVDLAAGDSTATVVATAIKTVLDGGSVFTTTRSTATLTITNVVAGAATDVGAGDSGFTVANATQGANASDPSAFNFAADDVVTIIAQRAN